MTAEGTQCFGDSRGRTPFERVDMVERCLLIVCLSWVGSC